MENQGAKWTDEDDNYLSNNVMLSNNVLAEKLKRTTGGISARKSFHVAKLFIIQEKDLETEEFHEDDLELDNFCEKYEVNPYYVFLRVKKILDPKYISPNAKPKEPKKLKEINFDEIKYSINNIDSSNLNIELLKKIKRNLTRFINKNKQQKELDCILD